MSRSNLIMVDGPHYHHGFSLVELVLVMLITGILAVITGAVITRPMQAYVSVTQRAELVDQAEMALRRMQRDIRRALPNSVRVKGNAVEMVNVVEGIVYREGVAGDPNALDFSAPDNSFNTIGPFNPQTLDAALNGIRLVIYNLPGGVDGTNVYDAPTVSHVITPIETTITIGAVVADEHTITMAPPHHFAMQSDQQRLYVVDTPITYICDPVAGTLTRYAGYKIQQVQPDDPTVAPLSDVSNDLVSVNITGCNIQYVPGTNQRPEIMRMSLTIREPDSGETVTLMHQVHVVNAS